MAVVAVAAFWLRPLAGGQEGLTPSRAPFIVKVAWVRCWRLHCSRRWCWTSRTPAPTRQCRDGDARRWSTAVHWHLALWMVFPIIGRSRSTGICRSSWC
jgi:hypothetical protein